ncbi:MAG: ABC transporter ATP-binding protein [Puniceicoccales bacterium]|jgi:iron(III) transport system ATP-binding protein|nr:ABC transporter ATP-binding protein [Puniceicoccales bacterium]
MDDVAQATSEIAIEHVVKHFGTVVALDDINLNIEHGELFFLLGPSGCGKTTLLRVLAGFYTPDEGHVLNAGKDITKKPPHKRQVGMVFQNYALWPHMTVAENVAFGLRQKKLPRQLIEERMLASLASVRMEQYANRKPNELSGGQQQRVALARALAVRPRYLLLDEPLSNLDAQLRNEMRMEIRRVCKENQLTTIYVTHDQKEGLSIADRIAVFSRGHVEQIGTPIEIYKKPISRFVAHFIGESNFLEGTILAEDGPFWVVNTSLGTIFGIQSDNPALLRTGDHVFLSIRPEAIRLRGEHIDRNAFEGTLAGISYFGEVAHYDFSCDSAHLKVSELNPRHLEISTSAKTIANVRPEDVLILQR